MQFLREGAMGLRPARGHFLARSSLLSLSSCFRLWFSLLVCLYFTLFALLSVRSLCMSAVVPVVFLGFRVVQGTAHVRRIMSVFATARTTWRILGCSPQKYRRFGRILQHRLRVFPTISLVLCTSYRLQG